MSETSEDLSRRSLRTRKLRDAALVLPFLGVFLFLTPIPTIFDDPAPGEGIPAIFTFIYGVWFALIAASAFISSRLQPGATPEPPGDPRK